MGINIKERISIFKQYREILAERKKDFFEAKHETELKVLNYFNVVVIFAIFLIGEFTALLLNLFNLEIFAWIIAILSIIYYLLALFTKVFGITGYLSYRILFYLFGRYGKVVSSKDWKNIRKYGKRKLYKYVSTRKSNGTCYFTAWAIAKFLQDAQLMYCSIKLENGEDTGHCVIVKNNCVYDTNLRRHCDYEEYLEWCQVKFYKIFSESEYRKETFLDDVWQGFKDWCAKNNVYCDPE